MSIANTARLYDVVGPTAIKEMVYLAKLIDAQRAYELGYLSTRMLRALMKRVDRVDAAGSPTWAINNIIRRHEKLPLKLIPA